MQHHLQWGGALHAGGRAAHAAAAHAAAAAAPVPRCCWARHMMGSTFSSAAAWQQPCANALGPTAAPPHMPAAAAAPVDPLQQRRQQQPEPSTSAPQQRAPPAPRLKRGRLDEVCMALAPHLSRNVVQSWILQVGVAACTASA